MELDNLKEAWQSHPVKTAPGGNEEILQMLQKKSQSPIAKMKRNLRWEMIAVVILYSASIIYYLVANKGRFWEISLMLLAGGILFMIYYYRKNKLLKEMECVTCEVKSNLQRQVISLEKYIRFYFIAGTLLTPVAYFAAGFVVLYKSPGVAISGNRLFTWFMVSGIVITIIMYFLNNWYVNKLYGQHVKKLKTILLQMEESGDSYSGS